MSISGAVNDPNVRIQPNPAMYAQQGGPAVQNPTGAPLPQLPAGEYFVQILPSTSGSGWDALTNLGGMYNLSGSPYEGTYLGYVNTLPAAQQASERAVHGTFAAGGLQTTPYGGYIETNTRGETYNFPGQAPAPAGAPPAGPPPVGSSTPQPPGLNATQQSAWAVLAQTLSSYGFTGSDLTNLENFVQTELINGTGSDQINLDLMNTPEFAARFPAIMARRQAGLPPISPAEYVSLERQYQQLERAAGLPTQMFDPTHYDVLIGNDVSATEYASRINQGYTAALTAPQETRDMLQTYYGVDSGHLAAYFLDPTATLPILLQRFAAAQAGGAAVRTGFGGINVDQAQRLAQLGVTADQAQQGFADLFHQRQLYSTLPGQSQSAIPTDQLIGSEFAGDEATKELLARRATEQEANFQASGTYTTTSAGVTGLGPVVR